MENKEIEKIFEEVNLSANLFGDLENENDKNVQYITIEKSEIGRTKLYKEVVIAYSGFNDKDEAHEVIDNINDPFITSEKSNSFFIDEKHYSVCYIRIETLANDEGQIISFSSVKNFEMIECFKCYEIKNICELSEDKNEYHLCKICKEMIESDNE